MLLALDTFFQGITVKKSTVLHYDSDWVCLLLEKLGKERWWATTIDL